MCNIVALSHLCANILEIFIHILSVTPSPPPQKGDWREPVQSRGHCWELNSSTWLSGLISDIPVRVGAERRRQRMVYSAVNYDRKRRLVESWTWHYKVLAVFITWRAQNRSGQAQRSASHCTVALHKWPLSTPKTGLKGVLKRTDFHVRTKRGGRVGIWGWIAAREDDERVLLCKHWD